MRVNFWAGFAYVVAVMAMQFRNKEMWIASSNLKTETETEL
jgi:hypothetical protein